MDILINPIKGLSGEIALPEGKWNTLCAMAMILAASSYPKSDLTLQGVSLDPKGRRMVQVFRWMNVGIEFENRQRERTGSLRIKGSKMRPTKVGGETAGLFLQEIPMWIVAGIFTSGEMVIRDIEPLREGEFDRIEQLVDNLRKMGIRVGEMPDGVVVKGNRRPQGTELDARRDGPLAMALALAGFRAEGEKTVIHNADGLDPIWPSFIQSVTERC